MRGLGPCPVKIMILEVRFLLTNFDSTSAIFKTLYLALNKINYYSENLGGGILGFGGISQGSPPLPGKFHYDMECCYDLLLG